MLRVSDRAPTASSDRFTLDDALTYLVRPEWVKDALCKEYPQLSWVPRNEQNSSAAQAVCRRCAVRLECLATALRGEEQGVWGGTTTNKRKTLRVSAVEADRWLTELVDEAQLRRELKQHRRLRELLG